MNFWKTSKRGGVISDLKNFIANLMLVQPVCHKYLKNRNFFSGKRAVGGGQSRFGNFLKIYPFWRAQASIKEAAVLCKVQEGCLLCFSTLLPQCRNNGAGGKRKNTEEGIEPNKSAMGANII